EDAVVCESYTLPDITGTDLAGDRAFYTEAGGAGTRYEIGETIATAGTYTLYAYAATAAGCTAETAFTVTITDAPQAGQVGADQSVCVGQTPAALVSVVAGSGSGTVAYRWEQSADGTTWLPIDGATGATYQPGVLEATTHYRRFTVSAEGSLVCGESLPTAVVTITVVDAPVANAGADQTKAGDPVFTLDGNSAAGTTGTWSVVSGTPAGTFSDLHDPKATLSLTPGTSVTLRWTIGNGSCEAFDEVVLTLLPEVKADLGVTKTVDNASALVGSTVVFAIEVTNSGPDGATGVEALDKLPSGYTFVSAEASTGSYDEVSGRWTIGALANGETEVLRITASLNAEGEYLNDVDVYGNEDDPEAGNNEAGVSVTPI